MVYVRAIFFLVIWEYILKITFFCSLRTFYLKGEDEFPIYL